MPIPHSFKAVLWDNDGILVDSEILFYELTRSFFAELGLELTPETWSLQYHGEGIGSREIALSLGGDPETIDPVLDARNKEYRVVLQNPPPIQPFVLETLHALRGSVKQGIVTGCHRDQLHLTHDHSGILDLFDIIVTADDCRATKPDPEAYLKAARGLGLDPSECIAIEDSRRGLHAAIAAGMPCIVVPTDLTAIQDFTGALSVEKDVSHILNYVQVEP
jgi:HAD superfamily hydrolase (TIGR01509 family)